MRNRYGLPFLRIGCPTENFELGRVVRQKAGKETAVQPVYIFGCVSEIEFRLQIEKEMNISERTGKVEQCNPFSGKGRQLNTKVHRHSRSPTPPLAPITTINLSKRD